MQKRKKSRNLGRRGELGFRKILKSERKLSPEKIRVKKEKEKGRERGGSEKE